MIKQINIVLSNINPEDYIRGLSWYTRANYRAYILGLNYGYNIEAIAGVMAMLSPGVKWSNTLLDTVSILEDHDARVHTYKDNKIKAIRILKGESPFDVIKGRKTRSFFHNIAFPETSGEVTIDTHMIRFLTPWKATKNYIKSVFETTRYERLGNHIKIQARRHNLRPCQLQAILWEYQRKGG